MTYTELELAGIDIDDLMKRLMQNASLVKIFIKKFLEDKNYTVLTEAFKQGDLKMAEGASHTLKGVCGNLSVKPLFALFQEQVALIRAGEGAKAEAMMPRITEEYEKTVLHMNKWLNEQ